MIDTLRLHIQQTIMLRLHRHYHYHYQRLLDILGWPKIRLIHEQDEHYLLREIQMIDFDSNHPTSNSLRVDRLQYSYK